MAIVIKEDIRFPVKIGVEARVQPYAETLISGEEQLLVTRTGKFFLTDGHGGFIPFDINDVYTKTQINDMSTINTGVLNKKIDDLAKVVVDLGVEFDNYVKTVDYDAFKLAAQNSISKLDRAILDVIDELGDTTTLATHANRKVLDKFDEDIDGNSLYNGDKLATSIEITDVEIDTAINTIWGDTV